MFSAVHERVEVVLDPIVTVSGATQRLTRKHLTAIEALSCGLMFGTSMVLPSLFLESLSLQGLYKVMLALWVVAVVPFSWINRMKLAVNGPYALAGLSPISILIILFSRTTLEQITPYFPFAIATGLIISVHIIPKITVLLSPQSALFPEEIRLATTDDQWEGSNVASNGSSRHEGHFHETLMHPPPWDHLLFSHMLDRENHNRRISSSMGSLTSVDLELGLQEDASSTASVASTDRLLDGRRQVNEQ